MLDLKKMNKIVEFGKESLFVTVQPGIVLKELDEFLIKNKLTHGHRPQTYPVASVAGTISHYGVGQEASGFGLLSDNVIGLTVVLADGEVLKIRAVNKSSMGEKNLLWLFLGRQGLHGIITEVTLRLYPYFVENRRVLLVGFSNFKQALNAAFAISREGFRPTMHSVRDKMAVQVGTENLESRMTLIFDGPRAPIVEMQIDEVRKLCEKLGGRILPEEAVKEFLKTRDIDMDPKRIKNRLEERDTTKPVEWSVWTSFLRHEDLLTFFDEADRICAKHGMKVRSRTFTATPMMTVIGLGPEETPGGPNASDRLVRCRYEVISRAIELGGTAATFHSCSSAYSSVAAAEFGKIGVDVFRRIKYALDPDFAFGRGQM
jgi:D-lactate dehydrogenase (cytochrome)